ncbi:MAG: hypothetical protein GF334_00780 [Candidatus Altiarchaeales archaeon]|nr:hypothetical protein [Candidatus Altiarchaeales archaeon]
MTNKTSLQLVSDKELRSLAAEIGDLHKAHHLHYAVSIGRLIDELFGK